MAKLLKFVQIQRLQYVLHLAVGKDGEGHGVLELSFGPMLLIGSVYIRYSYVSSQILNSNNEKVPPKLSSSLLMQLNSWF